MDAPKFTLAQAQKQAGRCAWAHRQFIGKTPPISKENASRVVGKTAIVTGSNSGLGLETSRQLLDLGVARLILAVRTVSKGEKAREGLLSGRDASRVQVDVWQLDLLSYDSIIKFAEKAKTLDELDFAILNAGHYRELEHFCEATGYEESVQVNYISTMLLTILLLPILKTKSSQGGPGRLVVVNSDTASWAKFPERGERPLLPIYKRKTENWNHPDRYALSKLLGQLFLHKLVQKIPSSDVIINVINPGLCYGTEIVKDGDGRLLGDLYKLGFRILGKPAAVGSRAIIHSAISFGEESHGQYTEDGEIRPLAPILYTPEGEDVANALWDETLAELPSSPVQEALKEFSN
ncbi:Short-chain dehydrogenase [Geosmithia morbida]|uniref:Short-chain dehydrogenase n=1 Tax=Geosmithia morbida TaxID=1094350 RepID=A0A9P4Z302_9HYPO|nr:Short-chain dehydrogenase [Geosmithia morbida]KAF4125699.1 Short-chain dehydrogenase [Geosmithia morbida]